MENVSRTHLGRTHSGLIHLDAAVDVIGPMLGRVRAGVLRLLLHCPAQAPLRRNEIPTGVPHGVFLSTLVVKVRDGGSGKLGVNDVQINRTSPGNLF